MNRSRLFFRRCKTVNSDRTACLVIIGPTAVGKSSFVYSALSHLPLHVISADSMQIYRGFDIGTATPREALSGAIPHSAINRLPPTSNYDVAQFLQRTDRALAAAETAQRLPVVAGGTAMYIEKFLYGLDQMPSANPEFRRELQERAAHEGGELLHAELEKIDPVAAKKIHPNDLRRTIRALEIFHESGRTKTELTAGENKYREGLAPVVVLLNRKREELFDRIKLRVDRMVNRGLVREVARLREISGLSRNIRQAIGFEEVVEHLEGRLDLTEMKQEIVANTKTFARKQLGWFRRLNYDLIGNPDVDRKELVSLIEEKIGF